MMLSNYVCGEWVKGAGSGAPLFNAVNSEEVARASTQDIDFAEMHRYAVEVGNPNLRRLTFHERARMLKALALHLDKKKKNFYPISSATGATRSDSWIDIEGGIGNLFTYASIGRREFPDEPFFIDGGEERISREGTFVGRHLCVPLTGVAIHINAFNFPCWGMLEKIAVNLLAGMPAIVKPATVTSYLTHAMFEEIIRANIFPPGSLQLVCGPASNLLSHITSQDVVTFTGSGETGKKLKKAAVEQSVRFNMEADSLNFCLLGPDASPESEEFKLFIAEVAREMTVKAGQKCTAIRRTLVPSNCLEPVLQALSQALNSIPLGNPLTEGVRMGPLAGMTQVQEVRQSLNELTRSCQKVYGDLENFSVVGAVKEKGAFIPAIVLVCDRPLAAIEPHTVEAFGPVNTVMPYRNAEEAVELIKRGRGSLVGSLFTYDELFAREIVLGVASHHGRLLMANRDCAKESTGHGSPLPHLVHGGPGRAGGGEELGGVRGVAHYMQRTALQGSPTMLSSITHQYHRYGKQIETEVHPFRKYFEDLAIGETLITAKRTVTETDIVNFANISGDNFYAHMDETSLEGSLFEKRVAHGYFIISAAAGLFVDPKKGPVLANYGLDELRFLKPVYVGSTIGVRLTVKEKISQDPKPEDEFGRGIVKWLVDIYDETGETVALATILTLVRKR
jgi:oxepin-CoA hydrolase/3-oxo-5,6-dehydrosuberyl-CoA semialdehyde dehydrogenase